MANRSRGSQWMSSLVQRLRGGGETLVLLSLLSVILHNLTLASSLAATSSPPPPHFEGFGDDLDDIDSDLPDEPLIHLPPSPSLTISDSQTHPQSPPPSPSSPSPSPSPSPKPSTSTSTSHFHFWDEDEFEGIPTELPPPLQPSQITPDPTPPPSDSLPPTSEQAPNSKHSGSSESFLFKPSKWVVEIFCASFLIMFLINYFTGKKENENLALAWAAKFATKDSIFDKNFSLLGVGEGDDSPLLLKEGQNVFKFYASGRRYCQGLLATMELKSRHDFISRIYNTIVPCKDEISFEVYMNDDAMDQVVFAVAKKKAAKIMIKELPDLQRFATLVSPPTHRKWVSEDLTVISESKEVAADLITDTVLDQVFGEKAFEKYGKFFISMHFSDQQSGIHKRKLMFKFALPDANNMVDMTRLVALVPYYIDLIGRYKLSSQARSKTDAARAKAAQEAYKELQNARQEAIQRKKAERRKMMEEAEAKLSAEAIRKKEAKERARQMKKAMPKMKMTRTG